MNERARPSRVELPISRFDYELPEELIAQEPAEPRDASRLLVVDRASGTLSDHIFRDLPTLIDPGDLLILNDTRVIHARLITRRHTGGRVEVLLLHESGDGEWTALARPARRLQPGEQLEVLDARDEPTDEAITFVRRLDDQVTIQIRSHDVIERFGRVPLPPYIRRDVDDPERYQTVYAERQGSAAAPTAGLHFTPELLDRCRERGIEFGTVTLHVGLDTFQPVKSDDALKHEIHSEWFRAPAETLAKVQQAKDAGRRVVAVGTTAVRTLESVAQQVESPTAIEGWTSLYITPPYDFRVVDAMITNFHLPRTTLLLLVAAFAGEDLMKRAYDHAIRQRYRFYSFGDAMLIL